MIDSLYFPSVGRRNIQVNMTMSFQVLSGMDIGPFSAWHIHVLLACYVQSCVSLCYKKKLQVTSFLPIMKILDGHPH